MGYFLRPAQVDDAPWIAKIHVETWRKTYRNLIPDDVLDSLSIQKKTLVWKEILEKSSQDLPNYWVIETQGHPVAWIAYGEARNIEECRNVEEPQSIEEWGTCGEVYAFYVHPKFQGLGYGTALLDQAITDLEKKGKTKAILWVLSSNTSAISYYRNRGWELTEARKTEDLQGVELEEISMVRYLSPKSTTAFDNASKSLTTPLES